MKFLKLDADVKPDELASLAYRLKERTPVATRQNAASALLAANPQLANARKIGKGSVIAIPDVPGTTAGTGVASASVAPFSKVAETLGDTKLLIKRLRTAAEADVELQSNALELLKSKEARADLKNLGDAATELIRTATAGARARSKETEARIGRKEKALQRMQADLAGLHELFR